MIRRELSDMSVIFSPTGHRNIADSYVTPARHFNLRKNECLYCIDDGSSFHSSHMLFHIFHKDGTSFMNSTYFIFLFLYS